MDYTQRLCLLCGKKARIIYNTGINAKNNDAGTEYLLHCSCEEADCRTAGLGIIVSRGLPVIMHGYAKEKVRGSADV